MTQLENSVTTVRLGKRAVPVVFFPSAVDFILLVCAGGRQLELLGRAAVDRRQLTGKMKSTALAIGMSGTASPRRTIVLSLAKANSVILESPERDVTRPFRPKCSKHCLGGTSCGTGERYLVLFRGSGGQRLWRGVPCNAAYPTRSVCSTLAGALVLAASVPPAALALARDLRRVRPPQARLRLETGSRGHASWAAAWLARGSLCGGVNSVSSHLLL